MKFCDLGGHISLAKFTCTQDKKSIIKDEPWSFDKHLVLISEVDGTKQVQQLKFHTAHF